MCSQSRQVNFSRTVWITFPLPRDDLQRLGHVFTELRQPGTAATGTAGRPRHQDTLAGKVAGEGLARRAAAREPGDGRYLRRRALGRQFILGGRSLEVLELEFQLVQQADAALGARAVEFPPQLVDLQPEADDLRLVVRTLRPGDGHLGTGRQQRRLQRVDVLRQRRELAFHEA